MQLEKFYVAVEHGAVTRQLLALRACNGADGEGSATHAGKFAQVLVYFHGFPDMAVHPTKLELASRLPFKIAEAWLDHGKQQQQQHQAKGDAIAFVTFNFGGVPGSDDSMAFYDKTISKEVVDATSVCEYIRTAMLVDGGRIHVVGVSTGAIIASLLRGKRGVADSITVIAGLADLKKGIHYDFSPEQLQQFDKDGACWKEFYQPDGCALPRNAIVSLDGEQEATKESLQELQELPRKVYFRLHRQYFDECTSGALDIQAAVSWTSSSTDPPSCPLLLIHGDADQNVPFSCGEELFAVAAQPKSFVAISKGNHLLTNSRHLKKALQAILLHSVSPSTLTPTS